MVTLLAFIVRIKKSILKYFIAEERSNVTVLDGQNQLVEILFRKPGSASAKWAI